MRRMMIATVVCLVVFFVTGATKYVSAQTPDAEGRSSFDGLQYLVNQLYLLAAAGLGAGFLSLYTANRFLVRFTFDPRYEPAYWLRFALGIIAGAILASFIQLNEAADHLGTPTIAMLGGLSAHAVQQILRRLVETLRSLVVGDRKEILTAREQAMRERLAGQLAQERLAMTRRLIRLQQELHSGLDSEEIRRRLAGIVDSMLAEDGVVEDPRLQ